MAGDSKLTTAPLRAGLTRRRLISGTAASVAGYSIARMIGSNTAVASSEVLPAEPLWALSSDYESLARSQGKGEPAFAATNALGVELIRFPVRWEDVQPDEFVFDWSRLDRLHRLLLWYGLRAVPVIVGCPGWLHDEADGGLKSGVTPQSASALKALGHFSVQLRNYFCRYGVQLEALEIWSEPNGTASDLKMPPVAYRRAISSVCSALGEVDNEAGLVPSRVIAGGVVTDGHDWPGYLQAIKNLPPTVDAAVHFPVALSIAPEGCVECLEVAADAAGRAVWVTVGIPESSEAATYLSASLQGLVSHPACAGIVVAQRAAASDNSTVDAAVATQQVFRSDWSLGPAYATLAAAIGGSG